MSVTNSWTKYLLAKYDDPSQGTIGVVDPAEKARFLKEEVGIGTTIADAELEEVFAKWKASAVVKAPYLSDLTIQKFKEALFNYQRLHIGDTKVSPLWNSSETVRNVVHAQQKGVAFSSTDKTSPARFTVELESVNAYEGGESAQMLSSSRLYIIPEGYRGSLPPSKGDKKEWCKAHLENCGDQTELDRYFAEIVPGKTKADSSRHEKKYANFKFTVDMPAGGYELHAVAGEYDNNDIDNFDVNVASQNASVDVEKAPAAIQLRNREAEVDSVERGVTTAAGFAKGIAKSAVQQAGREGVKGKNVDVVFTIDHSQSMTWEIHGVLGSAKLLVDDLKQRGAKQIRIGVVVFNDLENIEVLKPLTAMTPDNIETFLRDACLCRIPFIGGMEPLAEAAQKGLSLFDNAQNTVRILTIFSDIEGLEDDFYSGSPIYPDEVTPLAAAKRVSVKLYQMKGERKDGNGAGAWQNKLESIRAFSGFAPVAAQRELEKLWELSIEIQYDPEAKSLLETLREENNSGGD